MQVVRINPQNPSLEIIKLAAKIIKQGGIIIYPTDTIYGIGANALDKEAIDKIYKIKKRPENKPLSVIVRDIKMAKKYCDIGVLQADIFKAVFPGPFTLIFKAKSAKKKNDSMCCFDYPNNQSMESFCKSTVTVYKNTLSVRIPDYKITKLLSKEMGIPFAATSANISGLPGSGDIRKVLKQFGIDRKKIDFQKLGIDLVLDAGILPKKNPSTIIDLTGKNPKIIRK